MEKKKTKTQERPTRQLNEQKIQRAKKRRRKRIKNRIFCVFLLLLALVCASGIVYEGRKLRGKGTDAAVTKQENSADAEETLEKKLLLRRKTLRRKSLSLRQKALRRRRIPLMKKIRRYRKMQKRENRKIPW